MFGFMAESAVQTTKAPPDLQVKRPSRRGMTLGALPRALYVLAGALIAVAFFMPWLRVGDIGRLSGFEIMTADNIVLRQAVNRTHRMFVGAVPLLGVLMALFAFKGWRVAHFTALATGLYIFVFGISIFAALFFSATSLGLWLIIGAALCSTAVPALLLSRR